MYFPNLMYELDKVLIIHLHIMALSICKLRENQNMEGRTFLMDAYVIKIMLVKLYNIWNLKQIQAIVRAVHYSVGQTIGNPVTPFNIFFINHLKPNIFMCFERLARQILINSLTAITEWSL
jgi:hypothetical protein